MKEQNNRGVKYKRNIVKKKKSRKIKEIQVILWNERIKFYRLKGIMGTGRAKMAA